MKFLILLMILASCGKYSDKPQSDSLASNLTTFEVQKFSNNEIIVLDQVLSVCDSGSYFGGAVIENGGVRVAVPISNKCPLVIVWNAFGDHHIKEFSITRDPLKNLILSFNCPLTSPSQFDCEIQATNSNNFGYETITPLSPLIYVEKFQITLTPNFRIYADQLR